MEEELNVVVHMSQVISPLIFSFSFAVIYNLDVRFMKTNSVIYSSSNDFRKMWYWKKKKQACNYFVVALYLKRCK